MRNVIIVLILAFATTVAQADGDKVVFKYTNASGVVSYTDDAKRVPEAFKPSAEKLTLGALIEYERFTPVRSAPSTSRLEGLRAANAMRTVNPNKEECDGPSTITQERRERQPRASSWTGTNSYNSLFYVMRDSCGNEKGVTLTNPVPLLNVLD